MSDTAMLEQLAEVATVTNKEGVTEQLFILHPPKPTVNPINDKSLLKKRKSSEMSSEDKNLEFKTTSPGKSAKLETIVLDGLQPHTAAVMRPLDQSARGRPNKLPPLYTKNYVGFPCLECGKVFTLRGNLKVHMGVHSDMRPFTCKISHCGKSFRGKDMLQKHEMSHTGVKPWECGVCHKGFSSKNSMMEHEARHTNAKPYQCKQCGQEFRQYSSLSRHYMVHREEFPYQCSICTKRFKSKTYVSSHMKVHSGVAPFKCSICSKRFKHQSDLNRHSNIHTDRKPYVCAVCGTRFNDVSAKNRHEREHNGLKPFECQICGETYKRAVQLKAHMIKKHSTTGQLSAEDTAALLADSTSNSTHKPHNSNNRGPRQRTAIIECPRQLPPVVDSYPLKQKIEKRMITHHVAVPKVNGKAVGVDPVALLEHIKDQLDPSQMPQTVDGQPLQVSCKVIQQDKKQQVVELQYLSTVRVPFEEGEEQTQIQTDGTVITTGIDEKPMVVVNESGEIVHTSFKDDVSAIVDMSGVACKVEVLPVVPDAADNSGHVTTSQLQESLVDIEIPPETFVTFHMDDENNSTVHVQKDGEQIIEQQKEVIEPSPTASTTTTTDTKQEENILTSSLTENYVKNPDFSQQSYYNWLSAFADACKLVQMPLETHLFEKISNVNKNLADVMANPKGVLANKSNFIISMSISKELAGIIDKHLTYVLTALDNNEDDNDDDSL